MLDEILGNNTLQRAEKYGVGSWIGRALCALGLIFASGDLWPTVKVGFTFRLTQLCILAAAILLLSRRNHAVRPVPGFWWLYAFLVAIAFELPGSDYLLRSIGYTFWAITDVLTVVVLVQYFEDIADLERLLNWWTVSFIIIALFGCLQFLVGLTGHSVLTTEWWIPGRIPRVNGLSYEPSYFATYLIAGWVFSAYLLETHAVLPGRRLQVMCLVTTTLALLICSSRMGWLMMLLWIMFRTSRLLLRAVVLGFTSRIAVRRLAIAASAVCAIGAIAVFHANSIASSVEDVGFLAQGLGLFGESSHSARPRIDRLEETWRVFEHHPLLGVGIGALPVDIARQNDRGILNLQQAKAYQGMSIFVELLASTGIIGGAIALGFAVAIIRDLRLIKQRGNDRITGSLLAIGWGIIWMLGILQFNQNFLRIYLFTDLGVLLACISILKRAMRVPTPATADRSTFPRF